MALKNHDTRNQPMSQALLVDQLTTEELLALRMQIDERLAIGHLGAMDVGAELMIQLRTLKHLQHAALTDDEAPINQKAQAANSVSALLRELVKSRAKLYDAERAKQIEDMTIEAMKEAPEEAKAQFFESLERMLATLPTMETLMDEGQ